MKQMTELLQGAGFEIVNDGIRCQWVPDEAHMEECRQYGRAFGEAVK